MKNTGGAFAFTALVVFALYMLYEWQYAPTEQERRDAKQAACVKESAEFDSGVCDVWMRERPPNLQGFNRCLETHVFPVIEQECGPGSVAAWERHINKRGQR